MLHVIDDFLREMHISRASSTYDNYRVLLKNHFEPFLARRNETVHTIDRNGIQAFILQLSDTLAPRYIDF